LILVSAEMAPDVSDLHPKYFGGETPDVAESIGRRKALKERPPIQSCLRRGK